MDLTSLDDNFFNEFNHDFYKDDSKIDADKSVDPSFLECLKSKFGHNHFRPMQWNIISSILKEQRDNCVIMATGYGKSLCFQFPSVYLDTTTLVVSPLISLIEDQVLDLKISNIKAGFIGSGRNRISFEEAIEGEYSIIYVTPEYITGDYGQGLLQKFGKRLTLIAIDEAHCISKWGHDFRSAFRKLNTLRELCPHIPILAMTATATDQVRVDIIKSLNLRNPQILCSGFDRPNLEFNVRLKGSDGVWMDIGSIINSVKIGSIIIYCLSRSQTEEISSILEKQNVKCGQYHAGMKETDRQTNHQNFVCDKIRVMVATIAFGMGINKPDVRTVIHYGISKDLESYYQEVGRAGRDGLPAKCFMFYNRADNKIHEFLRSKSNGSNETKMNLEKLSSVIRDYTQTTDCRRKFILNYFEGSSSSCVKRNNCCDNCRNNISGTKLADKYENMDDNDLYDFTKDTHNLLTAISLMNGFSGLKVPILILKGSKSQQLNSKHYSHPIYGVGKYINEEWYKSLAELLTIEQFIVKNNQNSSWKNGNKFVHTIALSAKAKIWLSNPNRQLIKLKPSKDMLKFLKLKKNDPTSSFLQSTSSTLKSKTSEFTNINNNRDSTQELLKTLLKERCQLAKRFDVMPYIIASNKALYQLATKKPLNLEELKGIELDGYSEHKIKQFGQTFLQCILQFKNFLEKPSTKTIVNPEQSNKIKDSIKQHEDDWSSDDGIDFTQIDKDIELNNKQVPLQSLPPKVDENDTISGQDELDLLLDKVTKIQEKISIRKDENFLKRKSQQTSILYEDNSSNEEQENTCIKDKKKSPSWLINNRKKHYKNK